MNPETITLHCTENGSDKVYILALAGEGNDCTVTANYGRRGGALKAESKTPQPVPYAAAKAIYDRVLKEKVRKGYAPNGNATPVAVTPILADMAERDTGLRPQLLNPVGEADIERLLRDDAYVSQTKLDGERRLILIENGEVRGTQRSGLLVPIPQSLREALGPIAREFTGRTVIDGEDLGDAGFVAFDLLELDGCDLRSSPFVRRFTRLDALLGSTTVRATPVYVGEAAKRAHFERVRGEGGEGVVFKVGDSPYVPGRPSAGGDQVKAKFTASATLEVAAIGRAGKRSVTLLARRGAERVAVGNVTVPANVEVKPGELVEVRYLYRTGADGALFQPVLTAIRSDKDQPDDVESLKLKACA